MARFYRDNARWLAAGLVLTLCSSFGQTFFISLFAAEIKQAHGLTDGGWGAVYTAGTLTSAALLIRRLERRVLGPERWSDCGDTLAAAALALQDLDLVAVRVLPDQLQSARIAARAVWFEPTR